MKSYATETCVMQAVCLLKVYELGKAFAAMEVFDYRRKEKS